MSRTVPTDFDFNKELFTELLNRGQGDLSLNEYADKCGLSVSYMCKYLNGKIDRPPVPPTIKRIAQYTDDNGVTSYDLLNAAGYIPEKYLKIDTYTALTEKENALQEGTLYRALSQGGFRWMLNQSDVSDCAFSIDILDGTIPKWCFVFADINKEPSCAGRPDRLVASNYAKLVCLDLSPQTKYSFVTHIPRIYNAFKDNPPCMLAMPVSVILIDINTMGIVKEEYLDTAAEISDDIKSKYTLK